MDKKDTLKYHLSFNHYISCSHITFASPAFTLSRGRVEVVLTYPKRLILPFFPLRNQIEFISNNSKI